MSNATKPRKRVKPERRVQMSKIVNGGFAIAMTIGYGETAKQFNYFVESIPADFGLGFHFEKFIHQQVEGEPSEYDVNIDLQRGSHSCTCKGNTYCGHCKHVESVLALIKSGKIDVPAAKPEAAPKPQAKQQPAPQPQEDGRCFECGCPIPARHFYCDKHNGI
jgi:hypothetical protein